MNTERNNLAYVIAFAITNDRIGVLDFLSKNAVIVKDKITDSELNSLIVNNLKDSNFQQNFTNWVEYKTRNAIHLNSFGNLPTYSTELFPTSTATTSTATTTSSGSGSGFWSGFDAGAVTGFLSSSLNLFGGISQSKEQRKALEAQANAQIAAANAQANSNLTQLQIAQLQLQAAQSGKTQNKSNTTLIVVGVVGGLVVLGTVIYFVTRKK